MVDCNASNPTIFSIVLHHGGHFTKFPGRKYVGGKELHSDLLDVDTFSVHEIDDIMAKLGYDDDTAIYYHFQRPSSDLDFGMFALGCDEDVRHLGTYVANHKVIHVYTEHGKTNLHTYDMSPNQSKVRIVELEDPPARPRRLFLQWKEPITSNPSVPTPVNVDVEQHHDIEQVNVDEFDVDFGDHASNSHAFVDQASNVNEFDEHDEGVDGFETDESESDDSDYFVDEDNMIEDVDVDMKHFHMNIDEDVEWVGGSSHSHVPEVTVEEEVEVINTNTMLSGSSSDEGIDGKRKRTIRAIQRAHENDAAMVSEPFYLFQSFSSAEAFKEKVRQHSIETRREMQFEKNDKNRVKVVCKGTLPTLCDGDNSRTGKEKTKETEESEKNEEGRCPWVLYCSKYKRDVDWVVKTYAKEHKCLKTRSVRACDYKFLSKQIAQQVENNPTVPIRALREQLQRQYKVDISKMKTFRAKNEAIKHIRGDYATQYKLLRDYALEVQARNPDTTIKIDVESEPNPHVETRTFRRIYFCIGTLKKGFTASRRDFLGLDGAFMKGPYPGQILSAVAFDGNSGIYPLAYAVVEAETLHSWTWFLSNLGDDLGLGITSNFTFITDRQKGVLPAIAKLFPGAENRYCLRHIHENMKLRWRGKEFKDALWKCATTCNVQQFHLAMEELKMLNKDTYEWLKHIPPQHWARSHFTGRAHCDALLNNLCESFNSKLDEGRDTPIITCLEFIREYIMKKIIIVEKAILKATGPLTPTATTTLEKLKTEAEEYIVDFCGDGKYQVSGPWQDQCVVDMGQQTCSCKKWDLTGMPCKHAVASIWDMRKNNKDVGIPETFVHPCYWLSTWKKMYSFKIGPINGRSMWGKSPCPTTLLPPKHHAIIGRPKKKRTKSVIEKAELIRGNKVSRAHKSVTCTKCNNVGHNSRTCKGQRPNVGDGGPKERGKRKGKNAA